MWKLELPGIITGRYTRRPMLLEQRSSKWFIMTTVSVSIFTDIFLYAVIVPVIPFSLEVRSGVSKDHVQDWVSVLLAVYGGALLAFSPVCGLFADKSSSRRAPFIFGLLLLLGATILLCFGPNLPALIVGRILQGFSAGVVWVVGLALLVDTVGPKQIGEAMGYVSGSMSISVLLGPLLGGIVYHRAGYYAVFGMCFGLIGLDICLRLFMIEKKVATAIREAETAKQNRNIENDASSPFATSSRATEEDQIMPQTQSSAPSRFGAVQLPPPRISIFEEDKKRSKLPPVVTLLKSRRLNAALWGCLIQASLMTSFDSTLPLRTRQIFGWDSVGAGLIFLPIILPSFIAPLIGIFSDKYGPRWFATVGFGLACPILICLRFITYDSMGQKVLLCALLFLLGVTITIAFVPLMAEITYCVEQKELKRPGMFGKGGAYAQAYGLFNMAFAGGCLVGPIWAGLIKAKAGWGTMTWTLGLLSGFTAVTTAIWVGGRNWRENRLASSRAEREKEESEGLSATIETVQAA